VERLEVKLGINKMERRKLRRESGRRENRGKW
jgi:hypothetical protein